MDTAYFFTVDRITVTAIGVTFSPNHVFKHSKPGKELDSFHYRAYHNKKCCVVDCLKEYLKRRSIKVQTDTKALFIIYSEGIHTTHLQISCYQQSRPNKYRYCRYFKTGLLEKCQNIF